MEPAELLQDSCKARPIGLHFGVFSSSYEIVDFRVMLASVKLHCLSDSAASSHEDNMHCS